MREDPTHWSLTERPGFLRITTQQGGLFYASNNARNLLVQDAPAGDFEIRTRIIFTPTENFQMAGLLVYQDDDNFLMLSRAYCGISPPTCVGNGIYFDLEEQGTSVGDDFTMSTTVLGEAHLLLVRRGNVYTGYFSEDGEEWAIVGEHMVGPGFTPTKIGLATGDGNQGASEIPADFDFFSLVEEPYRAFLPMVLKD